MENKKLGAILLIIGIVLAGSLFYYNMELSEKSKSLGCFPSEDCLIIEETNSFLHLGIGIFSFIIALGFYLLFFNKTERAILEKLEQEKDQKVEDAKFEILMKALDPFERKVLAKVREQEGITQSTLRVKLDMSKAKLSYVLQDLEKKDLISRMKKGKTLSVHLKF